MANDNLARGISAMRKHVSSLSEQASHTPGKSHELLDEALEELRTSLEELQVAEEELHIQNEQLIRARNEVEIERARYQDLFEFAPDGYIVTSVEGIIQEANRAAAKVLGMAYKFLAGKPLANFIDEEARREFRHKITQLSRTSIEAPEKIESRLRTREGEALEVAMTVAAVFDHHKPAAFRWILRDITERKHAEEEVRRLNAQLERRVAERTAQLEAADRAKDELLAREQQARAEAEAANKSKDEFLATVSHELRTPLNAILGWTQILRSQTLGAEKSAHALEVIDRNAKSQTQIVDDLLEVSRIITGNLRLQKIPVSLIPVVEAAVESVRHSAEAKNISISPSLDPATGLVSGDPGRLRQVALNMLSNAIKFTPAGGSINISLERANDSARLTVSDTGEGIPPDFLPYIFDRFRQANSSSTRKHGGLGLGLSIVRHIIDKHGGTIRAESEGAGKGATFTVELPLIDGDRHAIETVPRRQQAKAQQYASDVPDLKGIWVVVIDDEKDARDMLKVVLQQWGAAVTALGTVAEVMDAMAGGSEGRKPDVLVADIAMPEEDGFDLIRKVRNLKPEQGGAIPAIALTAYAAEEDRQRVLSEGYQLHVAKPVSLVELAAVVERLARPEKDG